MRRTFALHLVDLLLLDTEGEAEVDALEDAVLAGPEHVGGLEVGVDDAVPVEAVEGHQQVLRELQTGPRRQPAPLILVDNL